MTKSTKTTSATTSKTSTEKTVTEPVIAMTASTDETKTASKPKKAKASKTEETKVVESTSTPVQTQSVENVKEEVVAATTTTDFAELEQAFNSQSLEFMAKLSQLSSIVSSLKTEYKLIEKKWTKDLKIAQKSSSKRKRKSGNRAPSGFVKATKISDELATFLEKPTGIEMARTDVTREINKYIRLHNLQDKSNGRQINPDSKLTSLLKLKDTDVLTYFNLQRYMSPHFYKAPPKDAAAPASVPAETA